MASCCGLRFELLRRVGSGGWVSGCCGGVRAYMNEGVKRRCVGRYRATAGHHEEDDVDVHAREEAS
jgi:hypothetical protein